MSSELIETLGRAWAGDLDALLSLYHQDGIFEDKAFGIVHHGHDGLREVFDFTYRMMPDFRVAYGDHVVTADYAASRWIFTGSFHGTFEGRRYAGAPVRIEGVSFMRLREGKIVQNTDYWNLASLAEQLNGATSEPAPTETTGEAR